MPRPATRYPAIVIGGGMFGCALALQLRRHVDRVLLLEKEPALVGRASRNNQARIHHGYHYPRSLLTAFRSRANYSRFIQDYRACVDHSVRKVYGVVRGGKVTAQQFEAFCQRIGAPLRPAPESIVRLFDRRLVERVYLAEELAFDAVKLKAQLSRDLERAGVETLLECEATAVAPGDPDPLRVEALKGGRELRLGGRFVFNCTYSRLNQLLQASELPAIPLKHELTEMALVDVPEPLRALGVTLMDGPYFSVMPYPPRGLHTLSHVRYTPHHAWEDGPGLDPHRHLAEAPRQSHVVHMLKDVVRYMPAMAEARYVDSLWEIKTVLPQTEVDDSRPILFRVGHGLPNFTCILGGKIDNVYDVLDEVEERVKGGWLR